MSCAGREACTDGQPMGATTCVQQSAALRRPCGSRAPGVWRGVEACGMRGGTRAGGGPDAGGAASARRPMPSATQGSPGRARSCRIAASKVASLLPSCGRRTSAHRSRGQHVSTSGQRVHTCLPTGHTGASPVCLTLSSCADMQQMTRLRSRPYLLRPLQGRQPLTKRGMGR